jgi:hypothetical protein
MMVLFFMSHKGIYLLLKYKDINNIIEINNNESGVPESDFILRVRFSINK